MVGELNVATAGHQATIEFRQDTIVMRFPNFRAAVAIASQPMPVGKETARLLAFVDLTLKAQIGSQRAFELYPKPSWIVRMLSPKVRAMSRKP